MALSESSCAENLWDALRSKSSLTSDGSINYDLDEDGNIQKDEDGTVLLENDDFDYSGLDGTEDYAEMFSVVYNDYAVDGDVPGADDGTEDKTILETALNDIWTAGNTSSNVDTLAQGFTDYWATVSLNEGEAQELDEVTNVTNDASDFFDAFKSAIQNSITSSDSTPYFKDFIDNIRGVVDQITWAVTEQDKEGNTQTFNRSIS